jgi:hypothetical protein
MKPTIKIIALFMVLFFFLVQGYYWRGHYSNKDSLSYTKYPSIVWDFNDLRDGKTRPKLGFKITG